MSQSTAPTPADARNLRVLLERRPSGMPVVEDFRIVEEPLAPLADGELRVRGQWLSLDPYMRGRMNEGKSYVKPVELGAVMCGEVVGEVVESRHPGFAVGDSVAGDLGWQTLPTSSGQGLRKLLPGVPPAAQLSVCGMPGITAWCGLLLIGAPQPGETVVVSAAAGAVGSVVGQIARLKGCRVVGIAGGADKCAYVTGELGFDACIDYKAGRLREDLKAATPDGIDVYFDNVGGDILDTVLARMNPFSRLPVCGLISQYNATEAHGLRNFRSVLVNRIRIQGFIVFDFREHHAQAVTELSGWLAAGKLKYRETIAEGLRAAPAAFIGMLGGANFGKQLVRLGG
jgi:NADPH-dependent curcumin reductase CurA